MLSRPAGAPRGRYWRAPVACPPPGGSIASAHALRVITAGLRDWSARQSCGVEIGIHQETEDRWEFDEKMPREPPDVVERHRVGEQVKHLVEQLVARNVDTMRRDGPGGATVSHVDRVLQNRGDACGDRARR